MTTAPAAARDEEPNFDVTAYNPACSVDYRGAGATAGWGEERQPTQQPMFAVPAAVERGAAFQDQQLPRSPTWSEQQLARQWEIEDRVLYGPAPDEWTPIAMLVTMIENEHPAVRQLPLGSPLKENPVVTEPPPGRQEMKNPAVTHHPLGPPLKENPAVMQHMPGRQEVENPAVAEHPLCPLLKENPAVAQHPPGRQEMEAEDPDDAGCGPSPVCTLERESTKVTPEWMLTDFPDRSMSLD